MRHIPRHHRCRLAVAVGACLTAALLITAKPRPWRDAAVQRKADYVMLQGITSSIDDRQDDYYAMLQHVRAIDPADSASAFDTGIFMLQLLGADSASRREGYRLVKQGYESRQNDFYTGLQTAQIAHMMGDTATEIAAYAKLHALEPALNNITYLYATALATSGRPGGREAALALYDTIERSDGVTPELTMNRMKIHIQDNDTAAIVGTAARLLREGGRQPGNLILMADVYRAIGQLDSAASYYDQACLADTTNALAAYTRAYFYYNQGDSAAFDREIFRVLKMDNLDMDSKMDILHDYVVNLYADSLQTPRILELFRAMTEINPHEAQLRRLYAAFLLLKEMYEEGAEQQLLAQDLDPSDEDGWLTLVSVYLSLEDLPEARRQIDRAIGYFPANPRMRMIRGVIDTQNELYDDAFADFAVADSLVEQTDDFELASSVKSSMGDLYAKVDSIDRAIDMYKASLACNPLNVYSLNNYAYLLACQNRDLDTARRMIDLVMDEEGDNPTWVDTNAWIYYKAGDLEAAKQEIDRAMMLYRQDDEELPSDILDHAGDIYYGLGLHEAALGLWKQALEADPDNEQLRRKVAQRKPLE